jgi:hypothetical protein
MLMPSLNASCTDAIPSASLISCTAGIQQFCVVDEESARAGPPTAMEGGARCLAAKTGRNRSMRVPFADGGLRIDCTSLTLGILSGWEHVQLLSANQQTAAHSIAQKQRRLLHGTAAAAAAPRTRCPMGMHQSQRLRPLVPYFPAHAGEACPLRTMEAAAQQRRWSCAPQAVWQGPIESGAYDRACIFDCVLGWGLGLKEEGVIWRLSSLVTPLPSHAHLSVLGPSRSTAALFINPIIYPACTSDRWF